VGNSVKGLTKVEVENIQADNIHSQAHNIHILMWGRRQGGVKTKPDHSQWRPVTGQEATGVT